MTPAGRYLLDQVFRSVRHVVVRMIDELDVEPNQRRDCWCPSTKRPQQHLVRVEEVLVGLLKVADESHKWSWHRVVFPQALIPGSCRTTVDIQSYGL